jgi:hypothetical protein
LEERLMGKRTTHVVPAARGGGWTVRRGGSDQGSKRFERKSDAVEWARERSRTHGADLVIHKKDGTIQEVDSYGIDSPTDED